MTDTYDFLKAQKDAILAKGGIPHGWVVNWPSPDGGTKPVYHASAIKPKFGEELDGKLTMYAVYTHPAAHRTDGRGHQCNL